MSEAGEDVPDQTVVYEESGEEVRSETSLHMGALGESEEGKAAAVQCEIQLAKSP